MLERPRQSRADYYGCDCDKYNPNCRCYPKAPMPPLTRVNELQGSIRSVDQIENDLKEIRLSEPAVGLREYTTAELRAEIARRDAHEHAV